MVARAAGFASHELYQDYPQWEFFINAPYDYHLILIAGGNGSLLYSTTLRILPWRSKQG